MTLSIISRKRYDFSPPHIIYNIYSIYKLYIIYSSSSSTAKTITTKQHTKYNMYIIYHFHIYIYTRHLFTHHTHTHTHPNRRPSIYIQESPLSLSLQYRIYRILRSIGSRVITQQNHKVYRVEREREREREGDFENLDILNSLVVYIYIINIRGSISESRVQREITFTLRYFGYIDKVRRERERDFQYYTQILQISQNSNRFIYIFRLLRSSIENREIK